MAFYKSCVKSKINPAPSFIYQIKNNALRIEKEFMSKEKTMALRELLVEGAIQEKPECQIEELVIDECGMDDEKVAIVLDALN